MNNHTTDTDTMKTESIGGVNDPKREQEQKEDAGNPTTDVEIDTVAEENGSVEPQTRSRIDNGMIVRNRKFGGKSPKVIRRFGKLLQII